MVTVSTTPRISDMPDHPDIAALIQIITARDPLLTGEGNDDNGSSFIILGGSEPGADFRFLFTKTANGYTMTRIK